jgi:hypothetical protein
MPLVPLPVFTFRLFNAVTCERLTKSLSCEGGTACVEPLHNSVDLFDQLVIKGHLNGFQ